MQPSCEVIVYGIPNCDQVRRARLWLREHRIDYKFHDFRADGLPVALLDRWLIRLPWDALLNKRGTTWRGLDTARRGAIVDAQSATELMLANPTVIKRPVLERGEQLLVGFSESLFASTFLA